LGSPGAESVHDTASVVSTDEVLSILGAPLPALVYVMAKLSFTVIHGSSQSFLSFYR
jgi:hypothetical protein